MKKYILLLSVLFVFEMSSQAQRLANIRVSYSKAKNGSVAIPNQPLDLSIIIYNDDTLKLKNDDTLLFYGVIDGDTTYFNINGKYQNYYGITGLTLNKGDSFIFQYALVFETAALNTEHDICVILIPRNQARPIQEQSLSNNRSCAHILVRSTLDVNPISGNGTQINVFPNPCRGYFSVSSSVPVQSIKIYDLCGREVQQIQPEDLSMIPLSLPSPGAYIVKFITATAVLARTIIAE